LDIIKTKNVWMMKAGDRKTETEVGSWKTEIRDPEAEDLRCKTGDRRQKTGNGRSEYKSGGVRPGQGRFSKRGFETNNNSFWRS
jgi:hypothetical protein